MARTILAGFAVLSVLINVGCSARQDISILEDGSGRGRLEITLDPVFSAYLTDVGMGFGASPEAPLFDADAIRSAFADRPGVNLENLELAGRNRLILEIAFESVEHVLAVEGESLARFLRFERTQGFRRVAAEIDRHAIEHFAALTGVDGVVVESLMPPDPAMSRQEYQDHLAWALEEYADQRPVERVFQSSTIVTTIRPAGEVVRVEGGSRRNGDVEFRTSLIEAVTAPAPLRYSLVFVP